MRVWAEVGRELVRVRGEDVERELVRVCDELGREEVRVCGEDVEKEPERVWDEVEREVGRETGTVVVCFGSRWDTLPATGEAELAGAVACPPGGER